MFPCIRTISKKEETMAAFEDLAFIPIKSAIKLIQIVEADFKSVVR